MRSMIIGTALAAVISSAASAATIITIHAEGMATGALIADGVIYVNPTPITADATFNLSKGSRITGPVADTVLGSGANSPGDATVDLLFAPATGWGNQAAGITYSRTLATSSFFAAFNTSVYRLFLSVPRGDLAFTSLDVAPPSGNLCAMLCMGFIGDIDGGTDDADVDITWSNVTLSLSEAAVVPEPTTWALMIVGFGAAGAALRHRRSARAEVQ